MIPTLILIRPTSFTARYLFMVTPMYILTLPTSFRLKLRLAERTPSQTPAIPIERENQPKIISRTKNCNVKQKYDNLKLWVNFKQQKVPNYECYQTGKSTNIHSRLKTKGPSSLSLQFLPQPFSAHRIESHPIIPFHSYFDSNQTLWFKEMNSDDHSWEKESQRERLTPIKWNYRMRRKNTTKRTQFMS